MISCWLDMFSQENDRNDSLIGAFDHEASIQIIIKNYGGGSMDHVFFCLHSQLTTAGDNGLLKRLE